MIRKFSDRLSNNQKQEIINLYNDKNWTIVQLAKQYNCDRHTMSNFLKINNIEVRNSIRDINGNLKYQIDELFFETIDTEEKAYWLGFLYADGYIKNNLEGFCLGLKEEDKQHLEILKKSLKSTHPIKRRGNEKYFYINIPRSKIAKDLVKLGCLQNKSLILQYPTCEQVPLELQHHFIRGYFDGDGCISWNNNIGRYDQIVILGTENFLNGVKNYLQLEGTVTISPTNSKTFQLTIKNTNGIYIFHKQIYNNATIYLDRKYSKFQHFLENRPLSQKRKIKIDSLVFDSIKEAANYLGVCRETIRKRLKSLDNYNYINNIEMLVNNNG